MDGVMYAAAMVGLLGLVAAAIVMVLAPLAVLLILRHFKVSWLWTTICATTTFATMTFIAVLLKWSFF